MRTKRQAPPVTARRAARGSGHTLTSGTSELLRTLGGILGDAYADDAKPEILAHLEAAKTSLLDARRTAQANS